MTISIPFIKCHGSGNDFVMVGDGSGRFEHSDDFWARLAQDACNRERQIGADGLLIVEAIDHPKAIGQMRMFNPNGSEAEMCGNGLRCAARIVLETAKLQSAPLTTLEGSHPCSIQKKLSPGVTTVSVALNDTTFVPENIPIRASKNVICQILPELSNTISFTALAIPNPHLVAFVDNINLAQLESTARAVLDHPELLPEGANVNFVCELGNNQLQVATFERGAGLTNACGSGMTASSVVACLLENVAANFDQELTIFNGGGFVKTLITQNNGDFDANLIGNATYELSGVLSVDDDGKLLDTNTTRHYHDETAAYEAIMAQAIPIVAQ